MKLNKDLAKIVSYITFDGHLAKDLKCFYLSSKNRETLEKFENIVYSKFKIKGRFENGTGYGISYKYRVFNREICKYLESIGVQKGCKVKENFSVPGWIKNDKEVSRVYLRIAFDCEGSIWFEKQPKIRFGICKIEELIENGFEFLQELKNMLKKFDVESTKSWIIKGSNRKDGKITKGIYFKIKQSYLKQFAKEIGFSDRFKNLRLSSI